MIRIQFFLVAMITVTIGCTPSDSKAPTKGATPPESTGSGSSSEGLASTSPWFEEAAAEVGLDFQHVSGADRSKLYIPEIVCGGVALLDYDNDGDLDVYCVQGGRAPSPQVEASANHLYRNRGDGTFEDVTQEAGAAALGYGMGCAANDVDRDGDIDIYVSNAGSNVFLVNQGNGTFLEASDVLGADAPGLTASAAFFDYDADGDLDLCVTEYVGWTPSSDLSCTATRSGHDYCQPNNYQAPTADHLFRNDGGRFVEVTAEVGMSNAKGNGLGVVSGDFDCDGRLDLFIANDGTHNHLWYQTEPGKFEERGLRSGTAVNQSGRVEAGMGVAAVDIDGDEDLDLFLSHLLQESNTLYLAKDGYYEDATDRYGLGGSSIPHTGFGLGFFDFDLDGDLDLFIANGRVMQPIENVPANDPYQEENLLYENTGSKFRVLEPKGGSSPPLIATSRGAAFGDLDGDGDTDIVVINRDGALSYLRNRREQLSDRHWVMFEVRDGTGAFAQHARVTIQAGDKQQTRVIDPHSSYLSSNDPRAAFGLGEATSITSVTVRWADGTEEGFAPPAIDARHSLVRGTGVGKPPGKQP